MYICRGLHGELLQALHIEGALLESHNIKSPIERAAASSAYWGTLLESHNVTPPVHRGFSKLCILREPAGITQRHTTCTQRLQQALYIEGALLESHNVTLPVYYRGLLQALPIEGTCWNLTMSRHLNRGCCQLCILRGPYWNLTLSRHLYI